MTENLLLDACSISIHDQYHGAIRNNQLFPCHPLKMSIKHYAMLPVKKYGLEGYLKMLEKHNKHLQLSNVTVKSLSNWQTILYIMQGQNTLTHNIIL